MRFSKSLALLFGTALCEAQISKPRGGDVLQPNQKFEIEWQTTGLQAPINIDLVPNGKTDLSVIAEKIGVQVNNIGRLNWTPSASITAFESFAIIITDSAQAVVISEPFQIEKLVELPVVQTFLGAEVQFVTAAAGPPKIVYSGDLPPEAIPAGFVAAEATPTEPVASQSAPVEETTVQGSPFEPAPVKLTPAPSASPESAPLKNTPSEATSIPSSPVESAPYKDILSELNPAPSAPVQTSIPPANDSKPREPDSVALIPTLSAPKVTPTAPVDGGGVDFQLTSNSSAVPEGQTSVPLSDAAETIPTLSIPPSSTEAPKISTVPESFPSLPAANNQTAPPRVEQPPAPIPVPVPTQPADIAVPVLENRTSIAPEAPVAPTQPAEVAVPIPANSTSIVPSASSAPIQSLPIVSLPLLNTSAPAGLPAIPTTEPAAAAPVPIAAPTSSNPFSNGTATAGNPGVVPGVAAPTGSPAAFPQPRPSISAPATGLNGTLPSNETLPTGFTPLNPIQTGTVTPTISGSTGSGGQAQETSLPGGYEGGDEGSENGSEKGNGGGGGSGNGGGSDNGGSDSGSGSRSGTGSGAETGSGGNGSSGERTGDDNDDSGSGNDSSGGGGSSGSVPGSGDAKPGGSAPDGQPAVQPQLGVGAGATSVRPVGPSVTLPSSLMTSMVLATAAGAGAPTGGLFAVTTGPAALKPISVGSRTTQSGYFAALASVAGAIAVILL
ncbi:hypothetical protein CDEST_02789 [Colletotrichum destructivum]|uniref:Yeast cell wall synthesis Kre9/Knh1-like N-terminal domain-containing protein n=1 Tax=Colletotrichum destructivum TaxID=34406 RepID=A0AAX4I454_9PEZI|nr:hypothetical protein CDEST_02789 [Colletotrichum destructivum]